MPTPWGCRSRGPRQAKQSVDTDHEVSKTRNKASETSPGFKPRCQMHRAQLTLPCRQVERQRQFKNPEPRKGQFLLLLLAPVTKLCSGYRQVQQPLTISGVLTAAPAASHQGKHTSETRLMRLSPERHQRGRWGRLQVVTTPHTLSVSQVPGGF